MNSINEPLKMDEEEPFEITETSYGDRISDEFFTHIRVSEWTQFMKQLREELPDINTMRKVTRIYLIGECILCLYLTICLAY